jgi:GDP-L-fucose synthase
MTSHVIPGMISKFHKAKIENLNSVTLWGDGSPLREFLYVDDLADAIFLFINKKAQDFIYNVGSNDEVSILELAELISNTVEFKGKILWDNKYPNGTPRKKLDSQKINDFGFKPNYFLKKNGLKAVYNWFKNNY